MDQDTGKPRGFGFVTFEDVRDAQDAVADSRGKVSAFRLPYVFHGHASIILEAGQRMSTLLSVSLEVSGFRLCDVTCCLQSLVLDGNTLRVNVAKYPRGGLPHERFDRRQGPPMRGR